MVDKKTSDLIRKYVIKNAFDYGKADPNSVIGKIIPFAKHVPLHELKSEIEKVAKEINRMKRDELEEIYKPYQKEFEKKELETIKKTERPRLRIDGAEDGKVVTRISPGPSGYMHIGHVKQALISQEVARQYNGKFYRYFDDTDPEKCSQEYVDSMMNDHKWLGLEFDKTYYASDFVDEIYKYARKIIERNYAYVCLCSKDEIKKKRFEMEECAHRSQPSKENLKLFNGMVNGEFKEEEAVVRYKDDMKSLNTVLRDPVLLRIVETPHYRTGTKYRVWPTYDFNTPIVDSLQGITDIIRSKEYELHDELSKGILERLGLRVPRMHLEARLNIIGNTTHKREIRELIEKKRLDGWDDPRLLTIMALRRRGILPESIRNFVMRLGMTKTDSSIPMEMLLAENKKLIDPIAKHMFFVPNPVKIIVKNAEGKSKMRLHPTKDIGFRSYSTKDVFFISKEDSGNVKEQEVVRLKDFVDARIVSIGKHISAEKGNGTSKDKIIQWVSDGNFSKCTVVVPGPILDDKNSFNKSSIEVVNGYVEEYASNLKEHEIVQFERFGYCILDDKKKMHFIFISK